ncbi:MAG TPA: serine/threonine-protein kinase, partial [Urbifossiella sp.]|nr:serine/threonine-protein kinase [Urbifossiella sp.]
MPSASVELFEPVPEYRKAARDEPLPGYVLLEPLGRGGFGEVWKCEAPGGLHKAVKFVAGANNADSANSHQFNQEFEAFTQIKTIRHPFLLTLERVELVGGDLVMVMELADRQMRDRYDECKKTGMPGIPREELLRYMSEAAEALDVINADYGLQHLDVKPANLFITAGHVKVGDYGLVSRLDGKMGASSGRGLTPKYVAPEVLKGNVDPRSDQYSLALVYQEMLTGTFPYPGRTANQMMVAHMTAAPDLSPLPESDRAAVGKALSKDPEMRFPLCQEFVRALIAADAERRSGTIDFSYRSIATTPGPAERTNRHSAEQTGRHLAAGAAPTASPSNSDTAGSVGNPTIPKGPPPTRLMPALVSAGRWPQVPSQVGSTALPSAVTTAKALSETSIAPPEGESPRVVIAKIRTVMPVGRLLGQTVQEAAINAQDFTAAIMAAAAGGEQVPQLPGQLCHLSDGSWICQFPSSVPDTVAPFKLGVICDSFSLDMDPPADGRIHFRRIAKSPGLWSALSGKRGGLEVVVQLSRTGKPLGEVTATGNLYGTPDRMFVQAAQTIIPKIIEDIRRELG